MKSKQRARDIMQSRVVSVSPELSVSDLEKLLAEEQISGAPVIDGHGTIVGIVSQTDIVRNLSDEGPQPVLSEVQVEEIMTRDVLTVPVDAEIPDVARLMIDAAVHRALVAEEEELVGIITSFDLLRLLAAR